MSINRSGTAALIAATTPMLALASPASAHNVCSTHPSDPSTVCLSASGSAGGEHRYLVVCDRDTDGNYAYARTFRNGVAQAPLYDQNGAASGCSLYTANASTLESFNVCVQNEQCGRPVYKNQF
jgi:hypothetical protein